MPRGGTGPALASALDFIRREDAPGKAIPKTGQAEGKAHLLVTAAGGDAGWQRDLLKRFDYPRYGSQLTPKTLPYGCVELCLPPLRHRLPQAPGDDSQRCFHAQAEELADAVLVAHLKPERRDSFCLYAQGDPVAVDQDSIAVEDHKPSHDDEGYGLSMQEKHTVRRWEERGLLQAVRLPSGVRRFRAEDVEAMRARMFSGFAPLREDDDVVPVTRVRPLD